MFYEEKEISDHLKCPHCRKIFVDPRILDCGESVCNFCIMLILNKEKTGLKCVLCNDFHEVPKNGFKKNVCLAKLVEIKPNEVSRSKEASEFKSVLNSIFEKNKLMETDLKTGKDKIREHCDFVRNEVEVKVESWHQYIDKFHDEFIKTIDDYEEEFTKNTQRANGKTKQKQKKTEPKQKLKSANLSSLFDLRCYLAF